MYKKVLSNFVIKNKLNLALILQLFEKLFIPTDKGVYSNIVKNSSLKIINIFECFLYGNFKSRILQYYYCLKLIYLNSNILKYFDFNKIINQYNYIFNIEIIKMLLYIDKYKNFDFKKINYLYLKKKIKRKIYYYEEFKLRVNFQIFFFTYHNLEALRFQEYNSYIKTLGLPLIIRCVLIRKGWCFIKAYYKYYKRFLWLDSYSIYRASFLRLTREWDNFRFFKMDRHKYIFKWIFSEDLGNYKFTVKGELLDPKVLLQYYWYNKIEAILDKINDSYVDFLEWDRTLVGMRKFYDFVFSIQYFDYRFWLLQWAKYGSVFEQYIQYKFYFIDIDKMESYMGRRELFLKMRKVNTLYYIEYYKYFYDTFFLPIMYKHTAYYKPIVMEILTGLRWPFFRFGLRFYEHWKRHGDRFMDIWLGFVKLRIFEVIRLSTYFYLDRDVYFNRIHKVKSNLDQIERTVLKIYLINNKYINSINDVIISNKVLFGYHKFYYYFWQKINLFDDAFETLSIQSYNYYKGIIVDFFGGLLNKSIWFQFYFTYNQYMCSFNKLNHSNSLEVSFLEDLGYVEGYYRYYRSWSDVLLYNKYFYVHLKYGLKNKLMLPPIPVPPEGVTQEEYLNHLKSKNLNDYTFIVQNKKIIDTWNKKIHPDSLIARKEILNKKFIHWTQRKRRRRRIKRCDLFKFHYKEIK